MSFLWTNPNTLRLEPGYPSTQRLNILPGDYTISFGLESLSGTSELNLYFEDRSKLNHYLVATRNRVLYSFDFTTTVESSFYFYAMDNVTDITISSVKLVKKSQTNESIQIPSSIDIGSGQSRSNTTDSTSHKGSLLHLESALHSADGSTSFLAHYDISTVESLKGLEPINDTSSLTYGKYGKGVAIEEQTTNIVSNGNLQSYSVNESIGWDKNLNGNLVATGWGSGYNSGVTNPTVGYHAHLNIDRFGYPVLEYIDKNSQFNQKHRWLGFSSTLVSNVSTIGWQNGTKVTISLDLMVDHVNKAVQVGLYHKLPNNGGNTFDNTSTNLFCDKPYRWERKTVTLILRESGWDFTKECILYIYGNMYRNDYEGIAWVKNIQVETKGFSTSYVNGTRGEGTLSYPTNNLINPNEGTISFWYKPHYTTSEQTDQTSSPVILQVGEYLTNNSMTLWNESNALKLYVRGKSGTGWSGQIATPTYPLVKDTWTMLSVAWKGKDFILYVNGKPTSTFTVQQPLGGVSGNKIYVGCPSVSGIGKPCNGTIDELRIDKIQRTPEEISAWYISNLPFVPRGVQTIAY